VSDRKLIERCQAGSQEAFRDLTRKYYQQAFSMAYYWTHNREIALDISQEAFIRVFKNLKKFDLNRSFKAWLFTIVKNLSLNYNTRFRKRRTLFSDFFSKPQNGSEFAAPGNSDYEKRELKQQVWQALGKLKENDRDIILLKDFEEYSYQEISEILNIPLGTVMSRLFNARKRLGQILEEVYHVR